MDIKLTDNRKAKIGMEGYIQDSINIFKDDVLQTVTLAAKNHPMGLNDDCKKLS